MTSRHQANRAHPSPVANADTAVRHVFVRDLDLTGIIGIYDHEKDAPQRIRVNLDLTVAETGQPIEDNYDNVVCYEKIIDGVRAIVVNGHINLVETLAERVADMCLEDRRVRTARVRIEKPDAFADAASVGVEIERHNKTPDDR